MILHHSLSKGFIKVGSTLTRQFRDELLFFDRFMMLN